MSSAIAAAMVGNRDIKVQYRRINLDEKLFVIVTSHDAVDLYIVAGLLSLLGGWHNYRYRSC